MDLIQEQDELLSTIVARIDLLQPEEKEKIIALTKEIFKISQFHGGESEVSEPRDIEDSELAKASGISVSELGKIKLLGSILSHPASGGAPGNDSTTDNVYKVISAGYNAFSFKSDYNNEEEIDWDADWD